LHGPGKLLLLLLPARWPMHDVWPLGHILHALAGGGVLIFPHVFEHCLNLHFTLVTQEHAFARHHQACRTLPCTVFDKSDQVFSTFSQMNAWERSKQYRL
jgi:hypothetical protein